MILHYIFLGVVSAVAMLLLCVIIINNEVLERQTKQFFMYAMIGTMIVTLCEVGTYFFEKPYTDLLIQSSLCNILGFLISPFIPIFVALSFSNISSRKVKFWLVPGIINLLVTVLSPFGGFLFTISPENIYMRGHWYPVYVFSYSWGILVLIYETIRLKKRYQTKSSFILYFILFFIMAGTSIQLFLPWVHTTWVCISLAISIYYAYFCELCQKFDSQTDLLNRRAYACEVERVKELGQATIFIFDVDQFKLINDTYGHPFGDYCLYTVARCIREVFQNIGLCFRIGGDEFCVISEIMDEEIIQQAKINFLNKISNCREKDKKMPNVSIGHGFYQKGSCKIEEAIQKADERLYHFKKRKANKNR